MAVLEGLWISLLYLLRPRMNVTIVIVIAFFFLKKVLIYFFQLLYHVVAVALVHGLQSLKLKHVELINMPPGLSCLL